MKMIYSVVFFVLVLALAALIFFLVRKENAGQPTTLRSTAGCVNETIADSVLDLRSDTTLIGAFISFKTVPSNEEEINNLANDLSRFNVILDKGSLTLDYMLAQIPTESLCNLAKHENVKLIFIPK